MKTNPLCNLLGIRYPILQGGMAWVSDASLAAAVSEGGGLGIISCIQGDLDDLRREIRKCRQLTDRPFGVNIMLMNPLAADMAQLVREEHVPVVTTGAGMPTAYMNDWLHDGIHVIPVVAASVIAMKMERIGACAVIAEGGESGGHIGEMNTMALVPQICDAVKIPVIAAGGIADGRGLAAAWMLGAQGVQCGTRFICAEECTVHDVYKQKILQAKDSDTIVTGKSLGHPVRALKTPFTRRFAEMEKDPAVTSDEILAFGSGSLRKAVRDGDAAMGSFMAGQSAGMVHQIQPAATILREMFEQAEQIISSFESWKTE